MAFTYIHTCYRILDLERSEEFYVNKLGETIANYKKKGDPILLEGRLHYRSWKAQDGSKRSKVDVVADNVQFLGSGAGKGNGADDNGSTGRSSCRRRARNTARS
jgi:single stranded DNA-binding protein